MIIRHDLKLVFIHVPKCAGKQLREILKTGSDEKNLKNIDQVLYAGSLGYYFRNNLNDFPKKGYIKIEQILKLMPKILNQYNNTLTLRESELNKKLL